MVQRLVESAEEQAQRPWKLRGSLSCRQPTRKDREGLSRRPAIAGIHRDLILRDRQLPTPRNEGVRVRVRASASMVCESAGCLATLPVAFQSRSVKRS